MDGGLKRCVLLYFLSSFLLNAKNKMRSSKKPVYNRNSARSMLLVSTKFRQTMVYITKYTWQ